MISRLRILADLRDIHSALDDALGDSDITHMEDDDLREQEPTQWAAQRVAILMQKLEADESQ